MTEPTWINSEMVRVNITVLIQRDTFLDNGDEYSMLTFDKAHPLLNELTADERGRILEELMESYHSSYIINGILGALSGKSARL